MKNHKATPEQWEYLENSQVLNKSFTTCLLELRSRLDNLEENLGFTVEAIAALEELLLEPKLNSKSSPNNLQIRSNSSDGLTSSDYSEKPDSSLVKQVASAISDFDDLPELWHDDARAAIREVATWLRESGSWDQITVAALLEQEAEHG